MNTSLEAVKSFHGDGQEINRKDVDLGMALRKRVKIPQIDVSRNWLNKGIKTPANGVKCGLSGAGWVNQTTPRPRSQWSWTEKRTLDRQKLSRETRRTSFCFHSCQIRRVTLKVAKHSHERHVFEDASQIEVESPIRTGMFATGCVRGDLLERWVSKRLFVSEDVVGNSS